MTPKTLDKTTPFLRYRKAQTSSQDLSSQRNSIDALSLDLCNLSYKLVVLSGAIGQ